MRSPVLLSILMAATISACGQSLTRDMSGTGGTGTGGTGTGGTGTGGSCSDVNSDSSNCGSCGHACASGQICSNGSCAAAVLGCQMSVPPVTPAIATFSDNGGIAPGFGWSAFGNSPQPTFTISGGSGNITDTIQVGAQNYYQGFGLYFAGDAATTDCLDASSYTGVSFSLSGSLVGTGCTMQFAIVDSEHLQSIIDPKGAGPVGSYAPQLAIASANLTATPVTFRVPFAGTGAPVGGSPPIPIDQSKLVGVQWWMATPVASDGEATECVWNINLTDVSFYE